MPHKLPGLAGGSFPVRLGGTGADTFGKGSRLSGVLRLGIQEILTSDAELQSLIMSNPSRDELSAYVQRRGIKTLFDDGMDRVRAGLTTIEEVSRTVNM